MSKFGEVICAKRKALGLFQVELFQKILEESGAPIGVGTISELEKGDRIPSLQDIKQFAVGLKISEDYLCYLTGRLPQDILQNADENQVVRAFQAFRKILEEETDVA